MVSYKCSQCLKEMNRKFVYDCWILDLLGKDYCSFNCLLLITMDDLVELSGVNRVVEYK